MPRVPTYDRLTVAPDVAPGVRQNSVASPALFQTAVLPAMAHAQDVQARSDFMTNLGNTAFKVGLMLQEKENKARVDDGMAQLAKADTDLSVEALQQRGRNAVDRPNGQSLADEYGQKYQQVVQGIAGGMSTQAQQDAFKQKAEQLQGRFYSRLAVHAAKQMSVYEDESDKASVETALNRAGAMPADNEAFYGSLAAINEAVDRRNQRAGGNDEMAAVQFRKLADQAFFTRYKAWVQDDPKAALASFQGVRNQIGPVMRDRIGDELFQAASPQLAADATPWVMGEGAAPAGDPVLANEPRPIRLNNPGAIVRGGNDRQGATSGADPRFESYATPEHGIRAMGKLLLKYQDGHGLDTVEGIISRWAPANENNTASYISTVSKALGVKPGDAVDMHDSSTMGKMVRAMIKVENGKQPYTDAQIDAGLNAALGTAELPAVQQSAPSGAALPAWRDPEAKTGNPLIDNLPPDQRARVFSLVHAQANQAMVQERNVLQSRVQDAAAQYLTLGRAVDPPGADDFIRAYGQGEGMSRYQDLQDTATLGQDLQQVARASNAEQAQMLADGKPDPGAGPGFAARQKRYEILQKAIEQTQDARRKDPMAYAVRDSSYGFAPIQGFGPNPQAVQQALPELGKRAGLMRQVAQDYGARPAILTNQEAGAFGGFLSSLTTEDKARVLGEVAQVVTPQAMESISAQLKDKSGSLAIAASLSGRRETQTHFFSADTQGPDVSLLYLQGMDAIDQGRVAIDKADETGVKAEIYNAIQGVYLTPQGQDAAAQAAYGVYAGLKAQGVDDVGRAVRLATGGVMQYNGGPIAKPFGWDDGKFQDAMAEDAPKRIKDAGGSVLVGGRRVSAADFAKSLPGRRLRTYGDGAYLVLTGSDLVRNLDGTPYILEVAPSVR
ncbi:MAG: hypothetical protein KUL86_06970 [Castellaniella sp.]|nr:hypothetical protein [Castellaniella sp.]